MFLLNIYSFQVEELPLAPFKRISSDDKLLEVLFIWEIFHISFYSWRRDHLFHSLEIVFSKEITSPGLGFYMDQRVASACW